MASDPLAAEVERIWWRMYYWWPLPLLETAVLMTGSLLLAQALDMAWDRRDAFQAMSDNERRSSALILLVCAGLSALWATGPAGIPGSMIFAGAFARWYVGEVIKLADEGRIGHSRDDEEGDQ